MYEGGGIYYVMRTSSLLEDPINWTGLVINQLASGEIKLPSTDKVSIILSSASRC